MHRSCRVLPILSALPRRPKVIPRGLTLLFDGGWESVHLLWDLGTDVPQHTHKLARKRPLVVLARKERDGFTRLAGSACTSTSVYKVLCQNISTMVLHGRKGTGRTGGEGERDIDDQADIGDIETSCGDIGSNENVDFTDLERVKSLESLILAQITVETHDREAVPLDSLFETLCFLLVQRKDEDTRGRRGGRRMGLHVRFEVVL